METTDYSLARVEGGVSAFDDVLRPDRSKSVMSEEPIPNNEGLRRYGLFVKSVIRAQHTLAVDEEFLAQP